MDKQTYPARSVVSSGPVVGQTVTFTIHAHPNEAIRLEVTSPAGVKTYKGKTNASGVMTYTFKAGSEGKTTIQAFNAANDLVSDQTFTVGAAADKKDKDKDKDDVLTGTGFDGMGLAAGGGVLVLAGAGAVVVAKRRRSARVAA